MRRLRNRAGRKSNSRLTTTNRPPVARNVRPQARDISPLARSIKSTKSMRLKPQDSKKQLLEKSLEAQRTERASLAEEINRLTASRNAALREVEAEGKILMEGLRKLEQETASKKSELMAGIASLEARRKT